MFNFVSTKFLAVSIVATALLSSLAFAEEIDMSKLPPTIVDALTQLKMLQDERAVVKNNIATFDTLDFEIYSRQQWDRFKESHTEDVLVHYPDGTMTKGLPQHIEKIGFQFVFAPDTKITDHPIKFGSGEFTAVVSRMVGSFSKDMPLPDGKAIPATNKKFDFELVTIGHWTKSGQMDEEWLYWDSGLFAKQLGLAP